MVTRLRLLVLWTAVLAASATLAVILLPTLSFAYWNPSIDAAIETAAAIVAILTAYLVGRRFSRTGELRDLALIGVLWILVITHLAFSTLPALSGVAGEPFFAWALIVTRLLGASMFAVAAFLPEIRLAHPRRATLWSVAALGSILIVIAATIAALDPPSLLNDSPASSDTARIDGVGAMVGIQLAAAALLGVAAVGFTKFAMRKHDELIAWFAIGLTLSMFSRLNYALFPSVDPEWVFTGDIFRSAFYLALLIGALRELGTHQRTVASAAVLEERRRMARDLHDGLAQELAFLSRESRRLAEHTEGREAAQLAEAADRALSESRQAISLLALGPDQPLDAMISQAARELTSRAGVELRLDLDPRADLPADGKRALARIVREAVWNGLRHGRATKIVVKLSVDRGLRLRVRDNGVGFDPDDSESRFRGFGLTGIQDRARALGGDARFLSRRGAGTEVEVRLP